jgi:hypothetical protein
MRSFLSSMALLATLTIMVGPADGKGGGSHATPSHSSGHHDAALHHDVAPVHGTPQAGATHGVVPAAHSAVGHAGRELHHLGPINTDRDYHHKHGAEAPFGWYYQGFHHDHWSQRCWFEHCGCHCYFCPQTLYWYYFCVPDNCWYPLHHCPHGRYTW